MSCFSVHVLERAISQNSVNPLGDIMAINYVNIKNFKKIIIIYNGNSGKQFFASMMSKMNEIFKHVKAYWGVKNVEFYRLNRFAELDELTERIAKEEFDWVIIAGGDGTIRAVIEKLSDRNYLPYFSIIPAGTVNLIAKELLISNDPYKWMRRVLKGVEVPVYLGRTNDRTFLTVTGIGFESLVVDNVTELEKKLLSKAAYAWEGAELMRKELIFSNWRYRFKVRLDDSEEWLEATSVIVGKSRYYAGRYNLFKGASLSKPELHVAIFTGASRADFARYAACIAMEALEFDKSIIVRKAKKLEIVCEQGEFAAELDGDAVATAPLKISIEEKPILFIA